MHSITDVKDIIHKYQRGDLQILTREDAIQYASTLLELLYQRDQRITEREQQRDQRKSTNKLMDRYTLPTPFVPPASGQVKLYLAVFCRLLTVLYPPSTCLLPACYPCSPTTLASMKKIFQRHRRIFSGPFQAGFRSASDGFQRSFSGVSDAVQDHYATLLLIGKGDRA